MTYSINKTIYKYAAFVSFEKFVLEKNFVIPKIKKNYLYQILKKNEFKKNFTNFSPHIMIEKTDIIIEKKMIQHYIHIIVHIHIHMIKIFTHINTNK